MLPCSLQVNIRIPITASFINGWQKLLAKSPRIIENHHNFAWKEKLADGEELVIHRKGATPAGIGDVGIIPGTMASPAYIVAGKGDDNALRSAAHGAGRLMSRNVAKKTFTESQLKHHLNNRVWNCLVVVSMNRPLCIKDIHEVMNHQKSMVNVLGLFYPKIVRME
jgi:tRNA-splicing ligase RtcB (3'-phosphate/5'-hydroxy nucleic acid ligase)